VLKLKLEMPAYALTMNYLLWTCCEDF